MATTRLYLDLRGKAKDKKGTIIITLFHNKSTASISTHIRVLPKEWDGSQVVRRSDSSILNAKLSKKKAEVDTAIANLSLEESFDYMSATDIKHRIIGEKKNIDRHLVSVLFDEYIQMNLAENTKKLYIATRKKVLAFGGKNLKISSITTKWLYDFEKYLSSSQEANGRSIYLRNLRTVCNYARRTGATVNYPFNGFQIRQEPTRKRNIEIERFREFLSYKTTPSNEMYRDYFLLMFYLIGINTVDLLMARKDWIINGRLEYVRQKTHKCYSIKIEPEAQKLIDKYAGKGDYLLNALDHCQHYRSFAHQMNDALKTIGPVTKESIPDPDNLFGEPMVVKKINPIIPGISTYYARHSWATIAAELDISSDVIAQALGHTNVNRVTMIYIKPNQSKVDEANRRVIDYLNLVI